MPEFTPRSVTLGIVMAAVFSAAAAFLGLKVGQVFEAAIPISILAVGLGLRVQAPVDVLENVIVQSVGAASGLVVAGSIFTLPALFILGLDGRPLQALPRVAPRRHARHPLPRPAPAATS